MKEAYEKQNKQMEELMKRQRDKHFAKMNEHNSKHEHNNKKEDKEDKAEKAAAKKKEIDLDIFR
jgi:hypothetical protein